jgi:acyl-CoA synthetase (AMP-forming)/AMP-acid ligase II
MTTPTALAQVAESYPNHLFLLAEDAQHTFAATAELVARIAAGLTARGLRPGDRIGLLLGNGARWCVTYLAAHAAGLTVVPLSTWYRADELAAVAARAHIRLIVTQEEILGQPSAELADSTGVPWVLWDRGEVSPAGLRLPEVPDPLAALRAAPVDENADALILFTSGSTAEPKAVRLSQQGVVRTAYAIGERQGVVVGDRIWFGSPLFFVYGCSNAIPNALTHAATLCLQERFEAGSALEFIEMHRCTVYYGVAPITRALTNHPDLARRDISSLRKGTGNATPDDLRLTIEVLGVRDVCNVYGLTEGHGHSTMTLPSDPPEIRIQTQGVVLPTQQLRIVVDGQPVPSGTPGQIELAGLITPGYLDSTDVSRGFTADGWFRTGDLGVLDSDGRLTYLGRAHDMMRVKGINVSPLEVERVLIQHPSVDEAFVFGVPTPEGDERIACVIVPRGETADLGPDVRVWLRERVSTYKVPSEILVLTSDQLPLTPTGKVSKRLMRDVLTSRAGAAGA